MVELAGFAPASSTHLLQYLQGISPCYYHTTAGRRKPLVFLIWYVDCGFSRLLSGLRRNQSTYQMARSYRAIGPMLTWGSVVQLYLESEYSLRFCCGANPQHID